MTNKFQTQRNPAGILDHCGKNTATLAARYAATNRAIAYPHIYSDFQAAANSGKSLNILDVGCGSGDDAFAFAHMGHFISAVEPSDLRNIAIAQHSHPRITYIDDTLPTLSEVASDPVFDAVLLSAVIQYIHPLDLAPSIARLVESLKPAGKLYISYPNPPSRPHQFDLPLKKLEGLVKDYNESATVNGAASLKRHCRPMSIPDSKGRVSVDGSPLMFHNITFRKS